MDVTTIECPLWLPLPAIDSLIAALARHHRLTFVTRNVKDFAGCGVELLNPWE